MNIVAFAGFAIVSDVVGGDDEVGGAAGIVDKIDPRAPDNIIGAGAAVEKVVAGTTIKGISASVTGDAVIAAIAGELVVGAVAVDAIVALAALDVFDEVEFAGDECRDGGVGEGCERVAGEVDIYRRRRGERAEVEGVGTFIGEFADLYGLS